MPKVSIVIPFHWMKNWQFFLTRCLESVESQTFKDYEIVLVKHSNMPITSNRAIESAKGELIKVLYMDDAFTHPAALEQMVEQIGNEAWLISGCNTNPKPYWTNDILKGNNKLGSPSCLMMKKELVLFFDERMSWLLDCDLYKRLQNKWGFPEVLYGDHITIGTGDHQMTNILTDEEKLLEHKLIKEKYA